MLPHSDSPNNGVSKVGSSCSPPSVSVESSVVDTVSEPVFLRDIYTVPF